MELSKKIIAVTGAGQGIGRAIALSLTQAGATLALIDVNADALEKTRALCGGQAAAWRANVADEAQVEAAFAAIVARFGRLDGLVNNAGIVRDALLVKARGPELVSTMTLAQWQAVIDVNLSGTFLCGRAAAAHMVRLGHGGVIVNMSSAARGGNVGQSNYSAAKAGVAALAVVWARELGRHGIRVGAIAPGFTRTDILTGMNPEMLQKLLAPVPLKRLGEVHEIAHAVRFIFENDFFTGRCLDLDGGLSL